MCKKIRVLYAQCGHTVTESMEYCLPWADRQAILDKEGPVWKCPNSSVELETDTDIVCGLCDENYPLHLKARRNNYTLGPPTPTGVVSEESFERRLSSQNGPVGKEAERPGLVTSQTNESVATQKSLEEAQTGLPK